jgi:multidrug resistance efflux pump
MELKAGSAIRPGTKVTITIEATVMQAYEGTATHLSYGDDNESALIIRSGESGVTIRTA